jgi:hypothetical protein
VTVRTLDDCGQSRPLGSGIPAPKGVQGLGLRDAGADVGRHPPQLLCKRTAAVCRQVLQNCTDAAPSRYADRCQVERVGKGGAHPAPPVPRAPVEQGVGCDEPGSRQPEGHQDPEVPGRSGDGNEGDRRAEARADCLGNENCTRADAAGEASRL